MALVFKNTTASSEQLIKIDSNLDPYSQLRTPNPPSGNEIKTSNETLDRANKSLANIKNLEERVKISINGAEANLKNSQTEYNNTGVIAWTLGRTNSLDKEINNTKNFIDSRSSELERIENFEKNGKETFKTISKMIELSEKLEKSGFIESANGLLEKANKISDMLERETNSLINDSKEIGKNYAKVLANQGDLNQKILSRLDNTICVMEGANKAGMIALASAATIGTGGVAGVVYGTVAGSSYAIINNNGQAALHIVHGNKTAEEAFKDAKEQTIQDVKTSVITASSTGIGLAAGTTVKGLGVVSQLGTKASTIISSSTSGTVGGASSTITQTGINAAEAISEFNKNYGHLKREDREAAWEQIKLNYKLDTKSILKDLAFSTSVGAIGGGIGGGSNILREGANTFKSSAIVVSELGADLVLGLGSASLKAKIEGRELSTQNVIEEVISSLQGTILGEATASIKPGGGDWVNKNGNKNKPPELSPEDKMFHDFIEGKTPIYKGKDNDSINRSNIRNSRLDNSHASEFELVGAGVGLTMPKLGAAVDGDAYVSQRNSDISNSLTNAKNSKDGSTDIGSTDKTEVNFKDTFELISAGKDNKFFYENAAREIIPLAQKLGISQEDLKSIYNNDQKNLWHLIEAAGFINNGVNLSAKHLIRSEENIDLFSKIKKMSDHYKLDGEKINKILAEGNGVKIYLETSNYPSKDINELEEKIMCLYGHTNLKLHEILELTTWNKFPGDSKEFIDNLATIITPYKKGGPTIVGVENIFYNLNNIRLGITSGNPNGVIAEARQCARIKNTKSSDKEDSHLFKIIEVSHVVNENGKAKTEIDVIAYKNNKLAYIEIKSAQNTHGAIYNAADVYLKKDLKQTVNQMREAKKIGADFILILETHGSKANKAQINNNQINSVLAALKMAATAADFPLNSIQVISVTNDTSRTIFGDK